MFRTGTFLLFISGLQSYLQQEPSSCLYQVNSHIYNRNPPPVYIRKTVMFRTGTILLFISRKQSCLEQEPFSCLYQENSHVQNRNHSPVYIRKTVMFRTGTILHVYIRFTIMFRTGTLLLFLFSKQPCLEQEPSSCLYQVNSHV